MSSLDLRPKKFSEIVNNEVNNKLLLTIAKNGGPSTILMNGAYGTGKTTSARLFAKAVNCQHLSNDICGKCDSCKLSFDNNPCYSEFDSSMVGRVENIRDMYEELTYTVKGKKRVICIDEAHLVTRAAQSALLKVFEDAPANIYYILCTTDKDSLLQTILSRSLILNFSTKSKEEVIGNINKIASNMNITLPESVSNLIALRSKGHMRDAHKLFEKYLLIGDKDFLELEESGYNYLGKYFGNLLWLISNRGASLEESKKHKEIMLDVVDHIMKIPIALLKDDYQRLFLDFMYCTFNDDYQCEPFVRAIVNKYKSKMILQLYKIAMDDFTVNSFDSDIRFKSALLSIYQRLLMGV